MKLCTDIITMYIPYISNGADTYQRVEFDGVSWYMQNVHSVTSDGVLSADVCTIRIPEEVTSGLSYVDYSAFAANPSASLWTLREGMVIVHGSVSDAGTNATPAKMLRKYGKERVVTVLSFAENTRGQAPHWRVTCK